jgi:hypothetical protein
MSARSNQTRVTRRSLKREWGNGVCRKVTSQLRMIDETSKAVSEKCAVLIPRRMQHVCRSSTGRLDPNQRPRVVLHPLSLSPRTQCNMNWPVSPWATHTHTHSCHSTTHYTHGVVGNVKKEQGQLIPFGRHGRCRTGNLMLVVSSNMASSACQ